MRTKPYTDVVETLKASAADPFLFGDLVDKWNAIFDAEDAAVQLDPSLDGVVDEAFHAIATEGTGEAVSQRLRGVIHALPHAAMVVRRDGLVSAMNDAAMSRLTLDPGDSVDDVPYSLLEGAALSDTIAKALDRRNAPSDAIFRRALENGSEKSVTIAIVPSLDDGRAQAMVFIIDPVWRAEISSFLASAYGLTTSESKVLMAFVDGYNLKEIAERRNTSYATVRTQIQTILVKTGAPNQATLMRNTIAVSQFYSDISEVAEVARHPNRKRFDILAAGARSIDVTLAGDFDGDLVISLADATLLTHTARVEAAFHSSGLCVASLCRPGLGRTDPPLDNIDYLDCLEQDIRTVAKQLGRDKIVLFGNNTSSVFAYAMARRMPDLLSKLVVKSTLAPAPALRGEGVRSPWARALMRALQSSDRMYKVIIYSAIKAWKALGSRRMLLMQLKGFEPDLQVGSSPDVVAEFENAMQATLLQGADYATLVFEYAAQDWSDWIPDIAVPIHLVQGRHDPSSSFASVETFASMFADQITLHVLSDAGYMTFLTHTDHLTTHLKPAPGADHNTD